MGSEADSAGARGGAVRCKARRTDASSTPGRTIVRNGTDDEDFEDTPELASSKRRGSSGSVVARPELAAVGSVRLSAAEARERLTNGGTGQRTLATKAAFRPSRWIQDLLPAGTGCLVVTPERRSFPQGRDGDQLHALAMNAVFDKEFGCSIQVRAGGPQGRRLGASNRGGAMGTHTHFVPVGHAADAGASRGRPAQRAGGSLQWLKRLSSHYFLLTGSKSSCASALNAPAAGWGRG